MASAAATNLSFMFVLVSSKNLVCLECYRVLHY